jgi:type I restriction enzyme S subunit
MSFSITTKVDESLDIFWNSINGVSSTRSLIFNLATTGKLVAQINNEKHPKDLLDSVNKGELAHESVSGWLNLKLNFCTEIFNGNSTNSSEKAIMARNQDGLNYIATKDVGYGFQPIEYNTGLRIGSKNNNFKIAPKNSVLICLEGGSAGKKMGLVEKEIAFGNKLFAVVCNNWIEPNYLLVYFLSSKFQSDFQAQMSGIIGGISKAKFSNLIIPLPPLEEQKRILDKIKELMNLCDSLETQLALSNSLSTAARRSAVDAISTAQSQDEFDTAWNRIQQNWDVIAGTTESIESLRNLILSLAISGNLTKDSSPEDSVEELLDEVGKTLKPYPEISDQRFAIPSNWKWVSLASIAEHQLGKMLHTAKMKGVRRLYLRSVNVRPNGTIDLTDLNEMLIPESELIKYNVIKGDLFVNEGGDVGRNAIYDLEIDFDLAFQNQLHRLRPVCGIEGRYIQFVLRQAKSQGVISQMSSGVTIQHFSASALRRFAIPLPPLSEQKLIVEKVNQLMEFCDELEREILEATRIAEKFARSVVSESA